MNTIVSKVKTAVNDTHVVVFNLMVSCMTAERQIDLAKLGIDVESLPSESRKLVQEKIFPKSFLNSYERFRDRANSTLDKGAAVRVEMGVISSRTEAVSKIGELDAIKADWADQIDKDRLVYESICNERIAKIAVQAFEEGVQSEKVNLLVSALKKRQPLWEEFVERMQFKYSAMPIQLELDENTNGFDPVLFQAQRDGVVALREGVFGGLVQYLARESSEILKVLNGKKPSAGLYSINPRTVTRIGSITEKLHGLSFVHKSVSPLAKVIDEGLSFIPSGSHGNLILPTGHFLNLLACLEAMSDQHELLGRLRDKQPLVEVKNLPALVSASGSVVAASAVAVEEDTVDAESSEEDEVVAEAVIDAVASEEVAVEPQVEKKLFDLPFMGTSLFG